LIAAGGRRLIGRKLKPVAELLFQGILNYLAAWYKLYQESAENKLQ